MALAIQQNTRLCVQDSLFALGLGPRAYLIELEYRGLPRIALYAAADQIAEARVDDRVGKDRRIASYWKEETRIYHRAGVCESDDPSSLSENARNRVAWLRSAVAARMRTFKAEELKALGYLGLSAVLLADETIYRDLISAGSEGL